MDFDFTDEQTTIRDLARGILDKEVTPERVRQLEGQPEWFDEALWSILAEAGLLGLAVESEQGGMGFGIAELCILMEEIGRAVVPVPVLPTLVLGGRSIAELGTDEQKQRWLAPMLAGEAVLTAALVDAAPRADGTPGTRARRQGNGWALEGRKLNVPAAHLAARCLIPAASEDGVGLFLVDPESAQVTLTRSRTSTGEPLFELELRGAEVDAADLLGDTFAAGTDALEQIERLRELAMVATCALQLGVSGRALEITSSYLSEREQFGVPIGSFQAVQHRMADGYIDLSAMRWTMWRAVWKLSERIAAERDVAVAKFWAGEGGARIATACQHLHGGIGVDVDYPIHRYLLWSKALELQFGAAAPQLAALGRSMARDVPREAA